MITIATEVYSWKEDTREYDRTKVYVYKEILQQYNSNTNEWEPVSTRDVYYKYNLETEEWEETYEVDLKPTEIDLWDETKEEDYDKNKIYVCRNIYYIYKDNKWESTNQLLIPTITVDQWNATDTSEYDKTKTYVCETKYYKYNIENGEWYTSTSEVGFQTTKMDCWTKDVNDLDKNTIYWCGPTYYSYDSVAETWVPSSSLNTATAEVEKWSDVSTPDVSKIYVSKPIYYKYDPTTEAWIESINIKEAIRNDGIAPDATDPKSFIVSLNVVETMAFNEKYKGRIQTRVYCDTNNITFATKEELFYVYPINSTDIFGDIGQGGTNNIVQVLDAGEIV